MIDYDERMSFPKVQHVGLPPLFPILDKICKLQLTYIEITFIRVMAGCTVPELKTMFYAYKVLLIFRMIYYFKECQK